MIIKMMFAVVVVDRRSLVVYKAQGWSAAMFGVGVGVGAGLARCCGGRAAMTKG